MLALLTMLWNISQLFLGEVVLGWDVRVAVCGLLHYVFVFEFVFSGISCCETRVWLCAAACTSLVSQALSSLRLGSGRQAGAPLTQDPPTKRCCKAIFIFWQQQISIKVVLGNIQGMVAHHLWGKHPIKSKLYSFYGMQLLLLVITMSYLGQKFGKL